MNHFDFPFSTACATGWPVPAKGTAGFGYIPDDGCPWKLERPWLLGVGICEENGWALFGGVMADTSC